ncbi:unnamed protein product [Cylicocyclus nassatus]|uniref:Uncharacterized protein n=1 Tax=Cylicocyclus nassatus TaxID=53992 RepID=A0AA36HDV9_CYLNA|nr:unnamed protein product [Cylicocyclus nassatus]
MIYIYANSVYLTIRPKNSQSPFILEFKSHDLALGVFMNKELNKTCESEQFCFSQSIMIETFWMDNSFTSAF